VEHEIMNSRYYVGIVTDY